MTILRVVAPHDEGRSLRAGITDLRTSIAAARRAFGEGRSPNADLRESGHHAFDVVDLCFPMTGHPLGHGLLDVSIEVDPTRDAIVGRLLVPGRMGEALLLAEQALKDAAAHPPEPDHADLVAEGLAWTILEERSESDVEVVIHRPTPWGDGRIGIETRERQRTVAGTMPIVRVVRNAHPVDDRAGRAALKALRKATLIHPSVESAVLRPTSTRVRRDGSDPMARLRALAAWAEFEEGHR